MSDDDSGEDDEYPEIVEDYDDEDAIKKSSSSVVIASTSSTHSPASAVGSTYRFKDAQSRSSRDAPLNTGLIPDESKLFAVRTSCQSLDPRHGSGDFGDLLGVADDRANCDIITRSSAAVHDQSSNNTFEDNGLYSSRYLMKSATSHNYEAYSELEQSLYTHEQRLRHRSQSNNPIESDIANNEMESRFRRAPTSPTDTAADVKRCSRFGQFMSWCT